VQRAEPFDLALSDRESPTLAASSGTLVELIIGGSLESLNGTIKTGGAGTGTAA
jgi:hypothetical protein